MFMTGYYDSNTEGASIVTNGKGLRTWICQLGIKWRAGSQEHSLFLAAREGKNDSRGAGFLRRAEVDGAALSLPSAARAVELPGGLTFTFVGPTHEGPFEADAYRVAIDSLVTLDVAVRAADPRLQTPDDAKVHLNVQFTDVNPSVHVHGVIGQTYRPNRVKRSSDFAALGYLLHRPVAADSAAGAGFLDGATSDYESSDVLAADCVYTAFGGKDLSQL